MASHLLLHWPEAAGSLPDPGSLARVSTVRSHGGLLRHISRRSWTAVVMAVEGDGDFPLVTRVRESAPDAVLAVFHPNPGVRQTVEAEQAGVAFLLRWPEDADRLVTLLRPYLTERGAHPVPDGLGGDLGIVGTSPALTEAYRTLARVAPSGAAVLVEGESGTGKELVARALHDMSPRRDEPFVAVNCAALPEGLLEAELFGHERGAFTGAVGRSAGRFGRADGGTLFLDEVGEMGPGVQAKLLRALESGEIERLGTGESVRVDVRIVAATNRDLSTAAASGEFREDLLYRLAVVRIPLPPLRQRMEDLIPLTEAFLAHFAARHGRPIRAISGEALEMLQGRDWPGNVRELRNVLDRAVLLARGGVVRSVDLADEGGGTSLAPSEEREAGGYGPTLSLREVEERHIRRVLRHTGGAMGEAAEILGVHRNTMTAKVREYGIDPRDPLAAHPE